MVEREKPVERPLGLIIVLQGTLAHGTVEQQVLVLGHEFEASVIVLDSPLEVAKVLPRDPTHLIGIDDKGVALYGHSCVLLSTPVVLQTHLGHRAVKIGFCQKGFCLNRLIKILYSKDVVLKVQGIAPDIHHLIGVDLSLSATCRCKQ